MRVATLKSSATFDYRGLALLHFEPRYRHAGHYLLYSKRDIPAYARQVASGRRWAPHPLVEAALEDGCTITVARILPGKSRSDRASLRARSGGLSRICPLCISEGVAH